MRTESAAMAERATENWYALYVKHQHEKSVAASLSGKGIEVCLPLYWSSNRWKDRTKLVLQPLFPNYLFVRTSLSRKLDLLRTPGVFWILESGGQSYPVPEAEIATVRMLSESPAKIAPHSFLKHGDQVRVKEGAFAGLQGVLTRIKSHFRVVVAIDVLHKGVAVEVDYENIDLLPDLNTSVVLPQTVARRRA